MILNKEQELEYKKYITSKKSREGFIDCMYVVCSILGVMLSTPWVIAFGIIYIHWIIDFIARHV